MIRVWLSICFVLIATLTAVRAEALSRIATGTPFSDTFTRANSESVGNGWSDTGADIWKISSNQLLSTGSGDMYHGTVNMTSTLDDYSWWWSRPSSNNYFFAFRYQSDSGLAFYQFGISGTTYQFYRFRAGGFELLKTWSGAPASGAGWFRISARGYQFYLYTSTDGVKWVLLGDVYDPLKVSSHGKIGLRDGVNNWLTDNVVARDAGVTVKGSALDGILSGLDGDQDEFDRADSETVGGIWTDDGTNTWRLSGNALYNDSSTGFDSIITDSSTDCYDCGFFFTFKFDEAGTVNALIRYQADRFYQLTMTNGGAVYLYKYDDAAPLSVTIANPGFESCTTLNADPPSWTVVNTAETGCDSATKRTGGWSGYVKVTDAAMLHQAISLTSGTTYTLSGYINRQGTGGSPGGYMTLTSGAADTGTNYCTTNTATALSTWTLVTCSYAATSTGTAYINLRGSGLSAPTWVNFDDITVTYLGTGFTLLSSATAPAFTVGNLYEVYLSAQGSTIRAQIAPEAGLYTQYFEYTDTTNASTHGVFGFRDAVLSKYYHIHVHPFSQWALGVDSPELYPTGGPVTLLNAGFESCTTTDNDPPDWTNNSAANTGCITTISRSGTDSAYVRTATTSMIYQSPNAIYLPPAYTMRYSAWARTSTGSGTPAAYITVSSAAADSGNLCTSSSVTNTATWAEVTCTFVVPQNGTVYVNFRGTGLTSTSTVAYFDDVSLTTTSANPNLGNNLYAPEIVEFNGLWRRYFGAYGGDGIDRIYMQTSTDTRTWNAPVLVVDVGTSGQWDDTHVNDPSAVVSGSTLYLYYSGVDTCASYCVDRVGVATSTDGSSFTKSGSNPVITLGGAGTWNEKLIGRPSVILDGATFKMWVDGQTPAGVSTIGLYTSSDGVSWTPNGGNPVYAPAWPAAAIHVYKSGSTYYLFNQGVQRGVTLASSSDGVAWTSQQLILPPTWETDYAAGSVTPQFFKIGSSQRIYVGQSRSACQCQQRMVLYQLYKYIEALTGTRNLVKRVWAINDTDVFLELEDVGNVTVNQRATLSKTSGVESTVTLTDLNWGDVLARSIFPVPYLWWDQQRSLTGMQERYQ